MVDHSQEFFASVAASLLLQYRGRGQGQDCPKLKHSPCAYMVSAVKNPPRNPLPRQSQQAGHGFEHSSEQSSEPQAKL